MARYATALRDKTMGFKETHTNQDQVAIAHTMSILKQHITDVTCRQKKVTLDGKPYKLEIWGGWGNWNVPKIPLYHTSFETENDCEKARDLVLDFLEKFRKLRDQL